VAEHSGIVKYEPVELVLTARAGTKLSEIETALDEQGQMLAFEPPHHSPDSTLGGTLACNLSGPGRPWTGSVRDHVLGVRLINGMGEHLRFGGQVMKNVAGYDVSRLQAGAMGTLGVITEISLKVLPKPATSMTLMQTLSVHAAIDIMNQRAAEPKPLSAACWVDGILYLRLSGAASAVEATTKQWGGDIMLESDSQQFWSALQDQRLPYFTEASTVPLWRLSIRPTFPVSQAIDQPEDLLIDWGGAQRWYYGDQSLTDMSDLAERLQGTVTLYRGGDQHAEVFHSPNSVVKRLQQNVKQSIDPHRIFNPGRLYHWL